MDGLYVPREEQDALLAINVDRLRVAVDRCLQDRNVTALSAFRLDSCGLYVATEFRRYREALSDFQSAKAAKKVDLTHRDTLRAGSRLTGAVLEMAERVYAERKETERFRIDDVIAEPYRLSEHLRVVIHYQWRATAAEEWRSRSIEFTRTADLRPGYTRSRPARKPSAGRKARDEGERLYAEWSHLRRLGLHAVRDFLRKGGDPTTIPKTFRAITERGSGLNNFSADFWRRRSEGSSTGA